MFFKFFKSQLLKEMMTIFVKMRNLNRPIIGQKEGELTWHLVP